MPAFTNHEKIDIVVAFKEAGNSARRAQRLYAARFPERQLPSSNVFLRTTVNLQTHGAFAVPKVGNQRVLGDAALRAVVVQHVQGNPHAGE